MCLPSGLEPRVLPTKTLYNLPSTAIYATFPSRLILLELSPWCYLVKNTIYETFPHNATSSCPLLPRPSYAEVPSLNSNSTERLVQDRVSFPWYERPSSRPIHNNTKNCRLKYFNVYLYGLQTKRQKILGWMMATIFSVSYWTSFRFLRIVSESGLAV